MQNEKIEKTGDGCGVKICFIVLNVTTVLIHNCADTQLC